MEKHSVVTNLDLFVILKQSGNLGNYLKLLESVKFQLNLSLSEEDTDTLQEFCRRFSQSVIKRWKSAKCNTETFKKHYTDWLEQNIEWPTCVRENIRPQQLNTAIQETSEAGELFLPSPSTSTVGTSTKTAPSPRKPFTELGTKQKVRRIENYNYEGRESSELAFALIANMKNEGKDILAAAIDHILKNPKEAEKIVEQANEKNKCVFTPTKALGLLLSLKLSKWQYITLRESAIQEGITNLYPSYYKVQQAKMDCFPPKDAITVTDTMAKVALQALLDITVKRIIKSLPDEITNQSMILISKWGFDGASSQSTYKQGFDGDGKSDESIFMTTLVPLKLTAGNEVIWENKKPCSALYCRPVQFIFIKESKLVVKEQLSAMEEEIRSLSSTECDTDRIKHNLIMTMIDGKVCTYLSEATSPATCYLCLAKPSEMNNLEAVTKKEVSTDLYKFGISSLHARINCMECLLHIAYRQNLKTWSVRGEENKRILEEKKKEIQTKFRKETGLLIDVVKQGSGTTNDGNTARKFFEFPEKTAAITGLDEELIRRFAVILQVISSGETIKIEKFKEYTRKTAEKYTELYNWYYMSATVHKVLIHGADIANVAIVPIGKLSEEASEARNKDFRKYRESHARKTSRVNNNQDILNMLLLSSDPYISSTRPVLNAARRKELSSEALGLISINTEHLETEFVDVSNIDPEDTDSDTDADTDVSFNMF